jgi:subtilisin family serine protease
VDPALAELLLRSDEAEEDRLIEAMIRLRRPDVQVPDVRIVSRFGSIGTCRLPIGAIRDVHAHPDVLSLKANRSFGPEYDTFETDNGSTTPKRLRPSDVRRAPGLPATGAGVVVAAVDWGLDFDHPNFKKPDGTTRLLALWDQSRDAGPSPEPYGYGTVYSRDEINAALASRDPYTTLGYRPARADRGGGTHATHVLDIAAGNGRAGGPVGIAPAADLVFVDLADRDSGEPGSLGDSVRLCEGIDFISHVAAAQPWVVNLSIGRHCGPHDGKSLIEMAFDELLDASPGRVIVQSAGNYYQAGTHASGELTAGQSHTIHLFVDPRDVTDNDFEIWYHSDDEFRVRVDPPNGKGPVVLLGARADLIVDGLLVGRVHHRARDPNNGDHHIEVFLYEPGPSGVWAVTLQAVRAVRGRFDAWIERDERCPGCQPRFITDDRDPLLTTGTIANSHLPLVVGAYNAHRPAHPIARFSSSGPTRDGRDKPDIAAPGVGVLAARSAPADAIRSAGAHVRKSGSSMATPHVTGAAALCLEITAHRLTARQIRALMLNTTDAATGDANRFGHGYLDVPALLTAVQQTVRARSLPGTKPPEDDSVMDIDADALLPLMIAPRAAFRELLYRTDGELSRWINERFEIIGRPRELLTDMPLGGDVLLSITSSPAGGQCCVLTGAPSTPLGIPGTYRRLAPGRILLRRRLAAVSDTPVGLNPIADDSVEAEIEGASSQEDAVPNSTTPARGISGEKSLRLAVRIIDSLRKDTDPSPWTNLPRKDVADRLLAIVSNPDTINQGANSLCGPAVFFNTWALDDPAGFALWAKVLYEKGAAPFGRGESALHVTAGKRLLHRDYGEVVQQIQTNPAFNGIVVPPADWMIMSALRDSENHIWDVYSGTPAEKDDGTDNGELMSWLRHTGLYLSVTNVTTRTLAAAKTLNPTINRRVILEIDDGMIPGGTWAGYANHFISLRSPITTDSAGGVVFKYWTWGEPAHFKTVTQADFKRGYYSAIIAES